MGLQFGSASSNIESTLGSNIGVYTAAIQDSLTAKEIFVGVYFCPFMKAELSRVDHGNILVNTTSVFGPNFFSQSITSNNLKFIFSKQIRNKLSVNAGVGFYLASVKQATDIPFANNGTEDVSGTIYTFGADFKINKNVFIKVNYNLYKDIGTYLINGHYDLRRTTIGIAYLFE